MDWIKKNYDRFTLALFAIGLLGVSVMLFLNAQGFAERFADSQTTPSKSRKLPEVDTARIAGAKKEFDTPSLWNSDVHAGLLFTSRRFIVKDGKLQDVGVSDGSLYTHSYTGAPIPNPWFTDHGLPLLDPNVPFQDPDGDGFANEDEWLHKTNPNSKESKPPFYTQLFLAKWVKVPFLLKFQAYDGNPTADPRTMTFQINTLSLKQPSEFLSLGQTVANTKFKLMTFKFEEQENPSIGTKDDVSKLTLKNEETGEEVVLTLNKVADSPNQFADVEYRWGKKHGEQGQMIRVPKLKEFVLQPQIDQKYKLLDVTEAQAVIQRPDGEKYTVPPVKK